MQTERTIAPHIIAPRTQVEVRCRFDGSWAQGFEIAAVDADAPAPYTLRRLSDGVQLPAKFAPTEVRPTP